MTVLIRSRRFLQLKREGQDGALFYNVLGVALAGALIGSLFFTLDTFSVFPLALTLIILNGFFAIYGQLRSIEARSPLHFISFLFCYLFMSLMPILQIGNGIDPVFNFHDVVLLSAIAGLTFTTFGLMSLRKVRADIGRVQQPSTPVIEKRNQRANYFLLAGLVFVFALISFVIFRKTLFTSRDTFGTAVSAAFGDKATGGLLSNFLMQTPFFGAVIGLRAALAKRAKFWIAVFSILLLTSAVINNPLITSRFKLAGLGFFFVDYFFRGTRIKLLVFVLVVGISLAPLFQVFRYEGTSLKDTTYGDKYISTDYDAFQMLCYTFLSVDRNGLTWGSNLAGAVLFWVPRSVWQEKPEPSSFEIYYTAHRYKEVGTNNLSVPLMIEGYYAFSWVGLVLISVLYWWAISRLFIKSMRDSNSLVFVLRCVVTGVVLIVLRGPLVIGVTAVVGNFLAAFVAWWIFYMVRSETVLGERYSSRLAIEPGRSRTA